MIFFSKKIFFTNYSKWYKRILHSFYTRVWRYFVVKFKRPVYSKLFCPHYRMYVLKMQILSLIGFFAAFYKRIEYIYITKINVSYYNNKMCFFFTVWLVIIFLPILCFTLFNINILYPFFFIIHTVSIYKLKLTYFTFFIYWYFCMVFLYSLLFLYPAVCINNILFFFISLDLIFFYFFLKRNIIFIRIYFFLKKKHCFL